jgi:hypothetical protein
MQPSAPPPHRTGIEALRRRFFPEIGMKLMTRYALTLAYAWSAVVLGANPAVAVAATDDDDADVAATEVVLGNVSKVNGSVSVEPGQQAGDVSTVNGSVTIGAGARVEDVETVNGAVRIDDRVTLESAESVNGGITVGAGSGVEGDVETVNGSITLRNGVRVGGSVSNVNGAMLLEGAEVAHGLETSNGSIRLATGSRVLGGIHVRESSNRSWSWNRDKTNPRITVEQGVVLQGPLHFEREVDLYVAPGVELPAIEGVAPKRYALSD